MTGTKAVRSLNLTRVLGSPSDEEELLKLLSYIETIYFAPENPSWQERGTFRADHSPGRQDEGAGFINFDPWQKERLTEAQVRTMFSAISIATVPSHAVGFIYAQDVGSFDIDGPFKDYLARQDTQEAEEKTDTRAGPQDTERTVIRGWAPGFPAANTSDELSGILEFLFDASVDDLDVQDKDRRKLVRMVRNRMLRDV